MNAFGPWGDERGRENGAEAGKHPVYRWWVGLVVLRLMLHNICCPIVYYSIQRRSGHAGRACELGLVQK